MTFPQTWTDDRVETLLRHLSERKTVTQIGKAMGITRSAAAGQINRLKRTDPERLAAAGYGDMQARGFCGSAFLRARTKKRLNTFADHLAEGATVKAAAAAMGVTETYGRILLARMRKDLGWQAQ